jgi:hypothetical protein
VKATKVKTYRAAALAILAGAGLPLIAQGLRTQAKPDVMALTPAEMK